MTKLKALILDMDGTITIPVLDFRKIRKEIGLPEGDIAETIKSLPELEQERAWDIIHRYEDEAMRKQALQPGVEELLSFCHENGVKTGILTRNMKKSVDALCCRFKLAFDLVITREFEYMKPHPAPIHHMLKQWEIAPEDAMMVGDYVHDIECGTAAGTRTCFFHNNGYNDYSHAADFSVTSMYQLKKILKELLMENK